MKNLFAAMQDMGKIQEKMTEMKQSMDNVQAQGKAGGDMVVVTVHGDGKISQIDINPNLLNPDEVEVLQDLLMAAFNNAYEKLEQLKADKSKEMLGGLPLPEGFKLPF